MQVHGHRGCRGYYPENTIEGFKKAMYLGATAIELDVVVSGDNELVVSHEPFMNHLFCQTLDGTPILKSEETDFNFYKMTTKEIQRFNCGARIDKKYPQQEKTRESKPSLQEVIKALDAAVFVNIEIKSEPQWYGSYQPFPQEYARLLLVFLEKHQLRHRCLVQSFDPEFLNAFYSLSKGVYPTGFLVEHEVNPQKQLTQLIFKPDYFNPDFQLLLPEHLLFLRSIDIKTLVWTVNEEKDIRAMIDLAVDGIISDYPDRVVKLLQQHG